MNQPHKHKDAIIAWANGEEIEYFNPILNAWHPVSNPCWSDGDSYRVKKEPIQHIFRIGLFKDVERLITITADSEEEAAVMEKDPQFIQWLTGWNSVELEELE